MRIVIDPAFVVGALDRRLFGSFVEHMGRCVYTGIYEPGHPTADADGFREDVLALVRELGVTAIRYPGGNFVSNYDWEDGVGPKESGRGGSTWPGGRSSRTSSAPTSSSPGRARPTYEPIWRSISAPAGSVRPSTCWSTATCRPARARRSRERERQPGAARHQDLVPGQRNGRPLADRPQDRRGVRAARRGDRERDAARRPGLELVACGSSNAGMPTFGDWERVVLERTYDLVDHISLHAYYEPRDGDQASFLAAAEEMDRMISAVIATADHVKALKRSDKELTLSFDEWNVWYQQHFPGELGLPIREVGPLIEDTYTVDDAVVVGSLLITLLRHADRVKIACLAQLVNVIGPIRTEPGGRAWRQTIFYPFAHAVAVRARDGAARRAGRRRARGDRGARDDGLTVFAVNRGDARAGARPRRARPRPRRCASTSCSTATSPRSNTAGSATRRARGRVAGDRAARRGRGTCCG